MKTNQNFHLMINQLTTSKSEEHKTVDEEELDDIDDHPPERDLQRPEVRVDGEQMHQFQGTREQMFINKLNVKF